MKFELVEFYPTTDKNRGKFKKHDVGTVHIYAIDANLDLRGIRVVTKGQNSKHVVFLPPHISTRDGISGEPVRYPVFRFTMPEDHKAMIDFLQAEVKPVVLKYLKKQARKAEKKQANPEQAQEKPE